MSEESRLIDSLLVYMNLAEFHVARVDGRPIAGKEHALTPAHFDGAEPMYLDEIENAGRAEDAPDRLFFADATPSDVENRLDVRVITGDYDSPSPDTIQLGRFRFVSPKTVRGKVTIPGVYVIEHGVAFLDTAKGQAETGALYYTSPDGKRWFNSKGRPMPQVNPGTVAMGVQFTRNAEWRAYIAWDGFPGITIPTDPTGARELFRLRDIPNGQLRRAALRNWVEGHWRKSRTDTEAEIEVRKHLRGATEFHWNGLRVVITPSLDDQRVNERLAAERASRKA